jgi:hypothetical protein
MSNIFLLISLKNSGHKVMLLSGSSVVRSQAVHSYMSAQRFRVTTLGATLCLGDMKRGWFHFPDKIYNWPKLVKVSLIREVDRKSGWVPTSGGLLSKVRNIIFYHFWDHRWTQLESALLRSGEHNGWHCCLSYPDSGMSRLLQRVRSVVFLLSFSWCILLNIILKNRDFHNIL